MLKFVIQATKTTNYLVGFGITDDIINLLMNDRPFAFDSKEVGLDGKILIAYDSEEWRKNHNEFKASFRGHYFVLTNFDIECIKNGSLKKVNNNIDFLFIYIKTELEFRNKFKSISNSNHMVKYSIIVPVYKHFEDCTKPCLESIIRTTDLSNAEVIVVANGCGDDGTKEFVESLGDNFVLIWFDEPLGYTKATNIGISNSLGEYLILLNNDIVILDDTWLNTLEQPFLEDPKMAITGPRKLLEKSINKWFLVFATVMIKSKFFDEFGLLDEIFNPGGGEDIDFAVKVQNAGYKIRQVPVDKDDWSYEVSFPMCHIGGTTVKELPNWEDTFKEHMQIIAKRHSITSKFMHNNQTFIFVHDQKIIDSYEHSNKFSKHYTDYKYVFLGNQECAPSDKTILARDFKDNIEDIPNAVAYTGWYNIWKNIKITTPYVNLFEYDICHDDISDITNKGDFIFYKESDVDFYFFHDLYLSKSWDQCPLTINKWMVSTNLTIKTEIFYEFMEWYHNDYFIKDKYITRIGHIFERFVSLFADKMNKEMIFIPNKIIHKQLDSHKTQGVYDRYEKFIKDLSSDTNQKKIISFSMYGYSSRYIDGAIENAKLQPKIYPGWKCRFYYDNTIKEEVIKQLNDLGAETIYCSGSCTDNDRKIWRFLVAGDPDVERFICRDADSRINLREKECVDKWIETNYKFHLIKDHPAHNNNQFPFFAGMWGGTRNAVPKMREYIEEWFSNGHPDTYWNDAEFLNTYIVPLAIGNLLLHESKDIETQLGKDMFIGQQYMDDGSIVLPNSTFTNFK